MILLYELLALLSHSRVTVLHTYLRYVLLWCVYAEGFKSRHTLVAEINDIFLYGTTFGLVSCEAPSSYAPSSVAFLSRLCPSRNLCYISLSRSGFRGFLLS